MSSLIVGSTAMEYLRENRGILALPKRTPSDMDIWTTEDSEDRIEMSGRTDLAMMPKHVISLVERDSEDSRYPSLDSLYTIKISHLGWDIFWQKHKRDAIVMKYAGAKLLPDLYDALVKQWKEEHGSKDFLSLNKNKDDFFTDAVDYVYDHDYLHELAAFPSRPVYESVRKDGHDVLIDKEKFFSLPFEKQVKMFREEITVIACERWLIPEKLAGKVRWTKAWQYALRKTCTTLTKNWATDFLVQNVEAFDVANYDDFRHIVETLNLEVNGNMGKQIDNSVIEGIAEELGVGLYDLAVGDVEKDEDYEHLEQEGGGEGGAEDCHAVFKYKDTIYMMHYNYYSHHGYEFDYMAAFIVEPVQKMVTVYE